ncbi:hypothetical protein K438DRAFT_1846652, partial [Mycena galopus ATCC 62051]
MAPRIPVELLEQMMDDLCADHKTVGVCGLVSTEWIRRSRHILFSTVDLLASNLHRFHELLASPACTFTFSVCRLSITVETHAGTVLRLSNLDWTCFPVFQQSIVESGLTRLTHLAKFELHSMTFHDLKDVLRVANSFPFLSHIRLIDVHFSKYLEYNISSAKTHQIPFAWQVVEIDAGDAEALRSIDFEQPNILLFPEGCDLSTISSQKTA